MIFRSALPLILAAAACAADTSAVAVLVPTAGNAISGTVVFSPMAGGLHVHAHVEGLAPNSSHGFHIHQFGDLRSTDGTSAGGHYNPAGHAHGAPGAAEHHAGDLGNLTANAAGVADLDLDLPGISVNDGPQQIAGRAVVVHITTDDLTSQPVGNAGARIAVGVIGVAAPPK
jgi:superoxide dismutase, Cu-Zn family